MRWFLQKAPPTIIPGSAAPAGSDGSTSHESDGIENSFESVNRRKAALHLKGGGQLGFFSMDLFSFDGVFVASWICSVCWFNSIPNVVPLYQLLCFTQLLLVKSWSRFQNSLEIHYPVREMSAHSAELSVAVFCDLYKPVVIIIKFCLIAVVENLCYSLPAAGETALHIILWVLCPPRLTRSSMR